MSGSGSSLINISWNLRSAIFTEVATGKKHGMSIAGGRGDMGNCENCIREYDCDWEDAEDCEEYVEEWDEATDTSIALQRHRRA